MLSTTNSPVTNLIAMIPMLTGIGRLMACLVPTDCLRSLEKWPPFHRAFRQSVGNPEAICSLYNNARQQPDGSYAWTGQPFLSPLKQIEMASSIGPVADKIMNDGYEKVKVIGLHRRSRRLITIVMPSKHITNWRLKTVYHPLIIKEMKANGGWLNEESHKEDILTMISSINQQKL